MVQIIGSRRLDLRLISTTATVPQHGGEVKLTAVKPTLEITGGGATPWKLTATTNAALVAGQQAGVHLQERQGACGRWFVYEFCNQFAISLSWCALPSTIRAPGSTPAQAVGIDQAPDGSGTLSVVQVNRSGV